MIQKRKVYTPNLRSYKLKKRDNKYSGVLVNSEVESIQSIIHEEMSPLKLEIVEIESRQLKALQVHKGGNLLVKSPPYRSALPVRVKKQKSQCIFQYIATCSC
jgi:hypothetical protein